MNQFLISENSLRFARTIYGFLALIALLLNNFWLVLVISVLMALGAISMKYNLFYQLYNRFLKGILRDKSEPIAKDPNETRFACTVGAIFLFLAFLFLYLGKFVLLGWSLVVVVLLSLLAGLTGICVGSLMYVFFKKIFKRESIKSK